MSTYIAVRSTQATPQPQIPTNEVPVIGNGVAAVAISLISILIGKWMPWGDLAKQFVGARTSSTLMSENRKNQELEGEIDINLGMSETISDLAKQGLGSSSKIAEDLLQLVGTALNSSAANTQSTQALSRASESQVEATKDLIKATTHNNKALEALREAIEAIPEEIASINKLLVSEIHVALNNIDARLEESNKIKHEGYTAIHEEIRRAETRIIEQYTNTFAQLRRDFKDLENVVKHPKTD
jgi:uncharacterized FlaG/YvyC family protein